MIDIPRQLRAYRFIKTSSEKKPIESGWTTTSNYEYDDPRWQEYIANNSTYGVLCGTNNLIVVDVDKDDVPDKLNAYPEFSETFIVLSARKRCPHYYFVTDKLPVSGKILAEDGSTMLDIQGVGRQVIGANSQLPDGRMYDVPYPEREIKQITYARLMEILTTLRGNGTLQQDNVLDKDAMEEQEERDPICALIKKRITMKQILEELGLPTDRNPTDTPFGKSIRKRCLSYNDDVWKDWHSGKSGSKIQLYQYAKEITFPKAVDELSKLAKIDEAEVLKKLEDEVDTNINMESIQQLVIFHLARHQVDRMTEVIANAFKKKYVVRTTRDDNVPEMLVFMEGIVVGNGQSYCQEFTSQCMGYLYREQYANQVIAKVEATTYHNPDEVYVNDHLNEIVVNNGIYNTDSKKLTPWNSAHIHFNKVPITYDPEAKCPAIMQFLHEVLDREEDIEVLQRFVGMCLRRTYEHEHALMLLAGGRNGKSKTLEIIRRMLGINNCTSISLQKLSDKESFEKANLMFKLANIVGDLGKDDLTDTGGFKSLTGRDIITANRKYKTHINFQNYAKMIFSCNQLPYTEDDSPAFFYRWIILNFKKTFVEKEIYDALPESEKSNYGIKDPLIVEKICVPQELSGFFNWSLEGLEKLQADGGFKTTQTMVEVKREWLSKSSSVNAFLFEAVEQKHGEYVTKEEFRSIYTQYCTEHKLSPETDHRIKKIITKFGAFDKLNHGKERKNVWMNIAWQESFKAQLKKYLSQSVSPIHGDDVDVQHVLEEL